MSEAEINALIQAAEAGDAQAAEQLQQLGEQVLADLAGL